METLLGLVAVFLLVFMNGFFVAAEFSLVGARRTRIAQLAAEGNAGAKSAENAIEHLDSYIAATQLGITLASLGLGWIGEPAVAHLFEPLLHYLPEDIASTIGHTASVAIAFSLVTMLHIVLGELAPKSIALQRPEQVSVIIARPTTAFLRIFHPIIRIMNGIGNAVVRLLGFEPAGGHSQVHSAEELEMLVQSSREAGLLQEGEERLLRRVFDFGDIHAYQIMKPRVDVDAVDIETPLSELLQMIAAEHHSRYPVYEESIDKVIGVLHTKDLFDELVKNPVLLTTEGEHFALASVMRTPLFVPETISVDKLLEKMQKTKMHLAIILDEYGGMAGLVTMEDILEELVGEVQDEFDLETDQIETKGDMAVLDGLVTLEEAIERFGEPAREILSATIGGYVAEYLDRIPTVGDKVPFAEYEITVEEMDGMRVSKIRFTKKTARISTSQNQDTEQK